MAWIIKMLLKVCKPFLKAMIWEAIFDYMSQPISFEDEPASEEPAEPAAEPVE